MGSRMVKVRGSGTAAERNPLLEIEISQAHPSSCGQSGFYLTSNVTVKV
ncbi:hypothetical protein [Peribacillus simplex]|nr:hypothetical protein [Peribacillus simplex]